VFRPAQLTFEIYSTIIENDVISPIWVNCFEISHFKQWLFLKILIHLERVTIAILKTSLIIRIIMNTSNTLATHIGTIKQSLTFAPTTFLFIASSFCCVLIGAALYILLSAPQLNFQFEGWESPSGLSVHVSEENINSTGRLEVVRGFENDEIGLIPVSKFTSIPDPDFFGKFQDTNQFFLEQENLWRLINSDKFYIITENGRYSVTPSTNWSFQAIPANFWLIISLGTLSFLIGISVWGSRQSNIPARTLAFSGFGFFLIAVSFAIYTSRELAMAPETFRILMTINHIGVNIFVFSILIFFWHYPKRISSFPATKVFYSVAIVLLINESTQWLDLPIHTYFLPLFITFLIMVIFSLIQWRLTSSLPLERAALSWILLSFFISITSSLIFFYIPMTLDQISYLPVASLFIFTFFLYLGLVVGVLRYKLFAIKQLWLNIWSWFIGGLLVIATDIVLIYAMQLDHTITLGISVVIVGWIYFPIRQRLFKGFLGHHNQKLEDFVPLILKSLLSTTSSKQTNNERYINLLEEIFQPSTINILEHISSSPKIANNGLSVKLPAIGEDSTLEMCYRDNGRKLFDSSDITLLNGLIPLVNKVLELNEEKNSASQLERTRIMRDLHDDVGAKLLTLVHGCHEKPLEIQARSAFNALRSTIYSLDDSKLHPLNSILADIEDEYSSRLDMTNISLEWNQDFIPTSIVCNSREKFNLLRISDEILTNILKHSKASIVNVTIQYSDNCLLLECCHNGVKTPPSSWVSGKGLNNIKTRLNEINGKILWKLSSEYQTNGETQFSVCASIRIIY